ncbi:MAG: hypothetical protein ACFB0C_22775 [Leptolyngbyaceae cyanobacterium]
MPPSAHPHPIKSRWFRKPLEALFPDKRFDGQFQNPDTGEVFDFDDIIAATDPISEIAQTIAYYPQSDPAAQSAALCTVFISGLGQTEAESSKRSRRYAQVLNVGIANLHNGSFILDKPFLARINPYFDWLDAGIHRLGLLDSPVIENTARLILKAIETETSLNLSGDSHGTILLARALWRARRKFIRRSSRPWDLQQRREAIAQWQVQAREWINVFTFGHGYRNWVKGPRYSMVYIEGDPLPEKFGLTPIQANRRERGDIKFLKFPRLFKPGNFEAHNMMFTIEFLKTTFQINDLAVGDFYGLDQKLHHGSLDIPTQNQVQWPEDISDYVWNPTSLEGV